MGTFVVGILVLALAGAAIRSIWKDKKSGKSCAGCSGCGGACGGCEAKK